MFMQFAPDNRSRPDGQLLRITNLDEFQARSSISFIEEARKIIDIQADPYICDFMANFGLAAQSDNVPTLSDKTIKRLDGSPQEFLIALLKYVDFSSTKPEIIERNTNTLAGFVAQRFVAITLVAHGKKLQGETSPFHPERHEAVLSKRAKKLSDAGLDASLARQAFSDFMLAGCAIQTAYMTDQNPGKEPMERKLQTLGITPAVR